MRLSYFLIGIFSFLSLTAQTSKQLYRPTITVISAPIDPVIDGEVIQDDLWKTIAPITNLTQVTPQYGAAISESTHIRLTYTNKMFYVSVVCFDQNPEKIVVSDSRRDADLNDEDSFLFIFDTYNDQQNGFLFGTNADAMQYDAQIDNEGEGNFSNNRQQGGVVGGTNINWDASWEVKTQRGEYGWSAEFAIPLKSSALYSWRETRSWGINFQRNISKNSEVAYWASLPLGFDIKRLSLAGKMKWYVQLKNPKNFKLLPYVIGQGDSRSKSTQPKSQNLLLQM